MTSVLYIDILCCPVTEIVLIVEKDSLIMYIKSKKDNDFPMYLCTKHRAAMTQQMRRSQRQRTTLAHEA